jgi:hypothetical protein
MSPRPLRKASEETRWPWLTLAVLVVLVTFITGVRAAAPSTGVRKASDPAPVTVWRFYNRITGVHFYTADPAERRIVLASYPNLLDEGAAYRALPAMGAGTTPVYRFYNTATGAHFYTADATERTRILATYPQFADEGPRFYAYTTDAIDRTAVHRFYNTRTQTHFYTASDAERDYVLRTYPVFVYEGIAWYALPLASGVDAGAKRDAFRLLDQATFGPTPQDVARAMQMGAAAWIEDQFAQPISGYPTASSGTSRSTNRPAASSARRAIRRRTRARATSCRCSSCATACSKARSRAATSCVSAWRGRCRRSSSSPA